MPARPTGSPGIARRREWVAPLVVACVTFIVFLPALRNGFVAWDDDLNFLDNHRYRGLGWEQLEWMWTTFHLGHYIPISWMTLGLDYLLWGMNPLGYHLTNLLLHTANAVLLYYLARRVLSRSQAFSTHPHERALTVAAAFAALLFAVHPLRVESVAWVTERRDMVSLLFYLLCVLFYFRAAEGTQRRRWLGLSVAMFLFALLSKATAMTLPAVLLLVNRYRLHRIGGPAGWWTPAARGVYLELLPFAALSAGTAIMSIVALHPPDQLSLSGKIAVSAYGLAFYLWKTIWPSALSPLYELPTRVDPAAPAFALSYFVVAGITGAALALRRRLPDVRTAWLVFVAMMLPMLGAVTNGPQIAADRYTYHASGVLAVLAAALLALAWRRARVLSLAVGTAMVVVLGALTWRQTHVWRDSHSLWSHVVRLDSASAVGHAGLGGLHVRQGRLTEAAHHYRLSVQYNPRYEEGHNNLGIALAQLGDLEGAERHFAQALAIREQYAQAHSNLGMTRARRGDLAGAIQHYQRAVEIEPDLADAHTNWGNTLVRMGRPDEAIAHYQRALHAQPNHADAQLNWGVALAQQGDLGGAIHRFERALAIDSNNAAARAYLLRAAQMKRR